MSEENINYLIILAGLTTKHNELIQLNWCCYSIEKRSVNAESSFLIKPNNKDIETKFLAENHINPQFLENTENLSDTLDKFTKFIKDSFISSNQSLAFVTKDKSLINEQLTNECKIKGISLSPIFEKNINLIKEFKNFYKVDNISDDVNLSELLNYLSLKQTDSTTPTLFTLNTIARIVNRMIKDGHVFKIKSEKVRSEPNIITQDKKQKFFYLRFKNIPIVYGIKDIFSQFYIHTIYESDIVISYDIFGRKTGEFCLKLYNENDFHEILTNFKYKYIGNNLIDCIEINQQDYLNCKESEKFFYKPIEVNDKIFLKMKNIPYSAKENDIRNFFKNYFISENGIKLLKNRKGNFLGEAVIAFMYEKDYEKALKEKNREMFLNQ